jgi:hypothetical protein
MPHTLVDSEGKSAASLKTDYLLIDDKEASKILHTTAETLAVWRCTGRYDLPYVKLGRKVRYKLKDVHDFIDRRTHNLASE